MNQLFKKFLKIKITKKTSCILLNILIIHQNILNSIKCIILLKLIRSFQFQIPHRSCQKYSPRRSSFFESMLNRSTPIKKIHIIISLNSRTRTITNTIICQNNPSLLKSFTQCTSKKSRFISPSS